MSGPRQVYDFLKALAIAEAQWELRSVDVHHQKQEKNVRCASSLCADLTSVDCSRGVFMLGGKNAYGPSFFSRSLFFAVNTAIGLVAGIDHRVYRGGRRVRHYSGAHVGWHKGDLAVGTSLFNIFAKAIMGTAVHRKLGNVSLGLAAIWLQLGSFVGVYAGGSDQQGDL